jgi:very-short-patch-repair endonuclease
MTEIYNRIEHRELRKTLRVRMTVAEMKLWYFLKSKGLGGCRFRRQYGIGSYVVDFYCPEAKLVIEVDGGCHENAEAALNDADRQKNIEALGLQVVRFTNEEVLRSTQAVLERIIERVHALSEK